MGALDWLGGLDPTIDALDPPLSKAVGAWWQGRARSELRVASAFATIVQELVEGGADPVVLELAARAVSDEVRHARICLGLASRYSGGEASWPEPSPVDVPVHEGAEPSVRRMLHVVGMCCIHETIASAWIEASLAEARGPVVRAALRSLLADEVDHARLGWAHLASSGTDALRREISAWLPRMLRGSLRIWFQHGDWLPEGGVVAHGILPVPATRAVVMAALQDLVLPGLERARVDVQPTRAWLEQEVVRH